VGGFSHKDTIRHFAYHLSQGTGYRVGDLEAFLDNQEMDRIELFEHILFGLDGSSLLSEVGAVIKLLMRVQMLPS
jgi:hypothetical protein